MNNLTSSLLKLSSVLKEVAVALESSEDVKEKTVTKIEEAEGVEKTEFELLKNLLESSVWPEAVPFELIVDINSNEDKVERAQNIVESISDGFLLNCKNIKFLEFKCAEGHIATEMAKQNLAVGFDYIQSGNFIWENDSSCYLTDKFENVEAKGPYDVILLYDVLDHVENPIEVLRQVAKVSTTETKIIVRTHPWCCRHGSHQYRDVNKAFVHVVFSEEELSKLNFNFIKTNKVIFPLKEYNNIIKSAGFKVVKEDVLRETIEKFFTKESLVKDRITKIWASQGQKDFPKYQLEQNFIDYEIKLL